MSPAVPRSSHLPRLMSGLIVVACLAAAVLGIGRLPGIPIDVAQVETEGESLGPFAEPVGQIITAPIARSPLNAPPSLSAGHAESRPALSSGWVPPAKRPVHHRSRRSPRRGGLKSPMRASALHSAMRPDKQFPAPANARSATSGSPVAVFTVLRN